MREGLGYEKSIYEYYTIGIVTFYSMVLLMGLVATA